MDDEKRKLFSLFLSMHSHKADVTEEATAHVLFYKEGCLSAGSPLIRFTRDDVLSSPEFDKESNLVRWLLKQMTDYDCTCQTILCLVFDPSTVCSEVLRKV